MTHIKLHLFSFGTKVFVLTFTLFSLLQTAPLYASRTPSVLVLQPEIQKQRISALAASLGETANEPAQTPLEKYTAGKSLIRGAFKGGLPQVVAFAGALRQLQKGALEVKDGDLARTEYWFKEVAGAEGGAIVAAMIASGFTADEIKDILMKTDFNEFRDTRLGFTILEKFLTSKLNPITWFGGDFWKQLTRLFAFITMGGVYRGEKFEAWFEEILTKKFGKNPQFKDLPIPLTITATSITDAKILLFNKETTPNLEISKAVRMSIGMPYFYEAYKWEQGEYEGQPEEIRRVVDGSLLGDFPIFVFDERTASIPDEEEAPVVGFYIKQIKSAEATDLSFANDMFKPLRWFSRISPLTHLMYEVWRTALGARDNEIIQDHHWAKTIQIIAPAGSEFGQFTQDDERLLYESGKVHVEAKLSAALFGLKGKKVMQRLKERLPVSLEPSREETLSHLNNRPKLKKFLTGKTLINGAFKGGGAKGVAYIGVLEALEEKDIWFKKTAGTSAGAITASLIAAGYTPSELRGLLFEKNFNEFKDRWLNFGWGLTGLVLRGGLYEGVAFEDWISQLIRDKLKLPAGQEPTFKDLPIPLSVVASDITNEEIMVFSQENTPDARVSRAVRMSMGIPFMFKPFKWKGKYKGKKRTARVVDGGLLSNLPMFVFRNEGEAGEPVVGFQLDLEKEKVDSNHETKTNPIYSDMDDWGPTRFMNWVSQKAKDWTPAWLDRIFIRLHNHLLPSRDLGWFPGLAVGKKVLDSSVEGWDVKFIEDRDWARTVRVIVSVGTMQFDLSTEEKEEQIARGKAAVAKDLDYALHGTKTARHLDSTSAASLGQGDIEIQGRERDMIIHAILDGEEVASLDLGGRAIKGFNAKAIVKLIEEARAERKILDVWVNEENQLELLLQGGKRIFVSQDRKQLVTTEPSRIERALRDKSWREPYDVTRTIIYTTFRDTGPVPHESELGFRIGSYRKYVYFSGSYPFIPDYHGASMARLNNFIKGRGILDVRFINQKRLLNIPWPEFIKERTELWRHTRASAPTPLLLLRSLEIILNDGNIIQVTPFAQIREISSRARQRWDQIKLKRSELGAASLGTIAKTIDPASLLERNKPVNVYIDYNDIDSFSEAQLDEEIIKLTGYGLQNVRVLVPNAPSTENHPKLDLPNVFTRPWSYEAISEFALDTKNNIHLSREITPPASFTKLKDAKFRYANDEHGLLGVALMDSQLTEEERNVFRFQYSLHQIDGFFSIVDSALLELSREHTANLVIVRSA